MDINNIKSINIIECIGKEEGGIGYILAIKDKNDDSLMFGYWSNGITQIISSKYLNENEKVILIEFIKKTITAEEFISSFNNIKNDNREIKN